MAISYQEDKTPTMIPTGHHTADCHVQYRHTVVEPDRMTRAYWCDKHGQWVYNFAAPTRFTFLDGTTISKQVHDTPEELTFDEELSILIADVEASKARTRIEADDLKADYLAGQYRKHGLTKRQCEDRLNKWNGEVLGHEAALSVLYKRLNNNE